MLADPNDPPREVERFKGKMVIIDYLCQIRTGYAPYLHCHQAAVPCSVLEIEDIFDPKTGEPKKENPGYLANGDGATVWIKPQKPLVIEKVNEIPRLSRFVLRDGRTVAVGMCIEIVPVE